MLPIIGKNTGIFLAMPWKFRRKKYSIDIIHVFFIYFLTLLVPSSQLGGLFPKIEILSSFSGVKVSSTCGLQNKLMSYCVSLVSNQSISTCTQRSCLFSCCQNCGTSSPSHIDLFKDASRSNGIYISANKYPGSDTFSNSLKFQDNGHLIYSSVSASSNFSFAAWINQESSNNGVLIHKKGVFTMAVKEFTVTFLYQTLESPNIVSTIDFKNVNIKQETWYHIVITVCGHDLALFVDGNLERTGTLTGILNGVSNVLKLGQSEKGQQYKGLMQDMKYYSKGLTNREVLEAKTGTLPDIPYTDCRCPESHQRLSPENAFYCMKNGASSRQLIQRLSEESHVPEYLVDGEAITYWLSEQVNQATIEIDLKYSLLQVFLVSILFYSPPPRGMKLERSLDFGKTYQPWQFFALNCSASFGMQNDGLLPNPDSVNCIQILKPRPSWEAISFQPAEAGPDNKPQRPFGVNGCADFYCSPKLMGFVQATNVKITLTGHSLVTHPDHRYFGIRRIVVGGTCECSGHASKCKFDDEALPHPKYVCECDPRTFTHGQQCDQCLPLYNDKLYAQGTVLDANPCKKCECHGHADSCAYNMRLDPDPSDRTKAGGGVCSNCKHNTIGRYCGQCKPLFYRAAGVPLDATDVCQSCDCYGPGVTPGKYECEKDDSTKGVLAGQCECKTYATGRQCTECRPGFYRLSSTNLNGCETCGCNNAGTVENLGSCHISSGQCTCKPNVIGVKCTNCKAGYYGLNAFNPLGCSLCNCNSLGSENFDTCHPVTGQCSCKEKYKGRACDRCKGGSYGPLCQLCSCNSAGVQTGGAGQCDTNTGQCNCKTHVTGTNCDQCKSGYFGLSSSIPTGCIACSCDSKGTIGNTGQCHQSTGVCVCKKLVAGRSCNLCKVGTYGLLSSKVEGCTQCNCFPKGTVSGDQTPKDQLVCTSTGQCSCLSNVEGKQCDSCITGYYWNPTGLGCLPCSCDISGSLSTLCSPTGQCQCKQNLGITGKRCNECINGYYGYQNGRCAACGCISAGSLGNRCDFNGQCTQCKRNVGGGKCNICKSGTVNLLSSNPYGCSGVPSQQGPPQVMTKTSTSISLAWSPPDDPNGIIIKYQVSRNGSAMYSGLSLQYTDQNLTPFTIYNYVVIAFTAAGSAKSVDTLKVMTTGDVPKGIKSPVLSQIKDRSAVATWEEPANPNGLIKEYILQSENTDGSKVTTHYIGSLKTYQVTGLQPFTVYFFTITVCTDIGCLKSDRVKASTRSAAPDSQPAPIVNTIPGGTGVVVTWDAPSQPNGQIQFYDLYQRSFPFTGEGNTVGVQLKPNHRSHAVNGLQPYTEYDFRIVSHTAQVRGSTSSGWTRVRTSEGAPIGASKPTAISPSGSKMDVSWTVPFQSSGIITRYEVYRYEQASSYGQPILSSSTAGNVLKTQISNLNPYVIYQFSIKACNSYSCTSHSSKVQARTLAAPPSGQPAPTGVSLNSLSIGLFWQTPTDPNGPTTMSYIVEKILPSFTYPPPQVVKGVQFTGFGHYQFHGSLIPDSATTLIEFYFKTNYRDGMMLYASSPQQEDLIVIELRDGMPWFIFDTESGPAAFTVSATKTFDDDQWHHVFVSRDMRDGSLTVDNYFKGSGSGVGNKNVIGQISNIFIGGLPDSFKILRADNGKATLRRLSFIGCMRDFKFKKHPLDFQIAMDKENVPPLTDHCPVFPSAGLFFKGHGYIILNKGVFNGGASFYLKFNILTVYQEALILYSTVTDGYFIVYVKSGQLYLQYKTQSKNEVLSLSTSNICNNIAHDIEIKSSARQLTSTVDGVQKSVTLLPSDLTILSETILGGMPRDSKHLTTLSSLGVATTFGGCIKTLQIGTVVDFQHVIQQHRNVDFNGCLHTTSVRKCTNPQPQTVYNGAALKSVSSGLKPYTEYLFRVRSYQRGVFGYGDSEWICLRSGEGAPSGISEPTATKINALSAKIKWTAPLFHNGLITHYYLRVYEVRSNGVPQEKQKLDVTDLSETYIKNLVPATKHQITIEAFTAAGGVESNPLTITTKPASPEGFELPSIERFPRALNISWKSPSKPNGQILFYQVELNGQVKYNGKGLSVYVDNLGVYIKYKVKITVCGEAGCAVKQVEEYTGELPPQGVIAPQLKVFGSKRIHVQWSQPKFSNGEITRYEVYTAPTTSINDLTLVFNATGATNETIINNLTPGKTYYVRVKASTKAGGTLGDAAEIKTLESAPEGVPAPIVTTINATAFSVQILAPESPNGIVTKYKIIQDGTKVIEGKKVPDIYVVSNLLPYSKHSFLVEICTEKGCGSSNEVVTYTAHGKPEGSIILTIADQRSRSFLATWTRITVQNGPIIYKILVTGEFYVKHGVDFTVVAKTVECFSGHSRNFSRVCTGLIPKAEYGVTVNGSNDAGFILSNEVKFTTLGDVPDGVPQPGVRFVNSSTISMAWGSPERSNGVVREYKLYAYYPVGNLGDYSQVVLKTGLFYEYTLSDLKPFANYSFWLEAINEFGSSKSGKIHVVTLETVPSDLDAPKISFKGARSLMVDLSPPAKPNGVIIKNMVYVNGTIANETTDTKQVLLTGLSPYTLYDIHIAACTKVGCTNSSGVLFRTLQDVPEGVSAPILTTNGTRSVVIKWVKPEIINGVIICYTIQRLKQGASLPVTVVKLTASFWNTYNDIKVEPFTAYKYRIVAETSVGGTPSPYNSIKTPQEAPDSVRTPTAIAISETALSIEWQAPTIPNGIIRHYLVSVSTKQELRVDMDVFNYTMSGLQSFVEYSVIISACTDGGCTRSPTVKARTLSSPPKRQLPPTAEVLSNTSLRVRWDEPVSPNGPIQQYILRSRTVESLVTNVVGSPTQWSIIYQGTGTVFDHTGLGIFSSQQYMVTCFTSEGNTTSSESLQYRTGPGFPTTGATIKANTFNHTSVKVSWSDPPMEQLKGVVKSYTVTYEIVGKAGMYKFGTFPGNLSSIDVNNLRPSTTYDFKVSLFNGAGSQDSSPSRATTLAGIPEGFDPPIIYRIEPASISVSWSPPRVPNGDVVNYTIIANDQRMDSVRGDILFHRQQNLKPYTSYIIKMQVCTTFMCILSGGKSVKTYAAAPTNLVAPTLKTISGTSIRVTWKAPMEENGIMIGYQLFRRSTAACPKTDTPSKKCTYISCSIEKQLCGTQCYDPRLQICCGNTLHPNDPRKTCCNSNFIVKNSPNDICCGGQFYPKQDSYQCCYGYFRQILQGQVCCQGNNGVITGNGNSCCGDIPYDENSDKVCICGALYDKAGNTRQCCGNKVVSIAETCCGEGHDAVAHSFDNGKVCCGTSYINKFTSLCCEDAVKRFKVHTHSSGWLKSQYQCCGRNKIPSGSHCCNSQSYDNSTQVCADRSTLGVTECGDGKTCALSQSGSSFCDRCDFDTSKHICSSVNGYFDPDQTTPNLGTCVSNYTQLLVNTKNPNLFYHADVDLSPHTKYDYYVVGINLAGNVSSSVSSIMTLMGTPESLQPPVPTVISSSQIAVVWSPPMKPNGVITKYELYRVKWSAKTEIRIYSGLSQSHLDGNTLEPYTGYIYTLSVCTKLCANITAASLVYTEESIPVNVKPPVIIPVSATSLRVNWSLPENPNGVIVKYNVTMVKDGQYVSILPANSLGEMKTVLVENLTPFTVYTFRVEACTKIGCAVGSEASLRTQEALPSGMEKPRVIVLSATSIDIEWSEPVVKNGVIKHYLVYKNGTAIYQTTIRRYLDQGAQPAQYYGYIVEAINEAGSTKSPMVIVKTPESSPTGIPIPFSIALSSSAVNVTWTLPMSSNGVITQFSVLYQEIDGEITKTHSDGRTWLVLTNLKPYTFYNVRVKVCTKAGCGVGPKGIIRTKESIPFGQGPPDLAAKTSTMVEIKWSSPTTPNGEITEFQIERREGTSGLPFVIYIGTRNDYIDSQLKPYTVYEYRIRARNIIGITESTWKSIRTLEGIPEGIQAPRVSIVNSTAALFTWETPSRPNGIITGFSIRYRLFTSTGDNIVEKCCYAANVFTGVINNFKPAARYEFKLGASTSAGKGFSSWTLAKLSEAAPSDVPTLKVIKNPSESNDGTTLEIMWDEPNAANGVITTYILQDEVSVLYEGLERKALIRRLQPYTNYTFSLTVCNSADCLKGPFEVFTTSEVTPEGQLPPTVNVTSPTSIKITWQSPLLPHGEILSYEIIREEVKARVRRAETVVYTTSGSDELSFIDSNLKPFTTYRYKVRTKNSEGSIDSEWIVVTTPEAPPMGVSRVNLTALVDTKVRIAWNVPAIPNGIVLYYSIHRNDTRVAGTSSTFYTDSSQTLNPDTHYSYVVGSCTSAGCTYSEPSSIKTLDAAPQDMTPPVLVAISPSSVQATWKEPVQPNGDIVRYQLFLDAGKIPIFKGYAFAFIVTGLDTYSEHSFRISGCTSHGCTYSKFSTVMTLEDTPDGVEKPSLYVVGATAIDVRWSPPSKPNGIIKYYLIQRGSTLVYNGTDLQFTDRTVSPGQIYQYRLVVYNSVGSRPSLIAISPRTDPSAPSQVSSPALTPLTSTDILANWNPPGVPNGIVTGYYVLYDKNEINVGNVLQYTASSLRPYTMYEFRVKACTSADQSRCTTSLGAHARSLEAPPEDQTPPYFESQHITANSIKALWHEPRKPNGEIVSYALHRRIKNEDAPFVVYKGPDLSIIDANGLKANTAYEYKVVSSNKAGSTESAWSAVTTSGAVPTVLPLSIDASNVFTTSFKGFITAPKGEIEKYYVTLESNGREPRNVTNIDMIALAVTVTGLVPTTTYNVRLYACNEAGCGSSEQTIVKTKGTPPTGFDIKPTITWVTTSAFGVTWPEPTIPNGIIEKYELIMEHTCPQVVNLDNCIPFTRTIPSLKELQFNVTGLLPYTLYGVRVKAYNNKASFAESKTQDVRTLGKDPKLVGPLSLSLADGTTNEIVIDWSKSFDLRSELKKYSVYENDLLAYSGTQRTLNRPDRVPGTYRYFVTLTTDVNGKSNTVNTPEASIAVIAGGIAPNTAASTGGEPWYKTVWFLALCALAFVLLVFLLIVCCCRGYRQNRTVYVRQREPLARKEKVGMRSQSRMDYNDNGGFPSNLKISSINHSDTFNEIGDLSEDPDNPYITSPLKQGRIKHNDAYEQDDFIWDNSPNATRDLDSGLYDDDGISPAFLDPEIEHTEDGFVSLQHERILFPDTHL